MALIVGRSVFLASTCICALALGSSGAFAQDAPASSEAATSTSSIPGTDSPVKTTAASCIDATGVNICPAASEKEIIVTGSRIRKDNYSSTEPLTIISRSEMTQQGFASAASVLQSNGITQGSAQINNYYGSYVVNGGTGVNTISLRGLGPTRTLVLLNGHRLAPAGTRGAVGSVDANVLPSALIDTIQVLKAGASSIYGSDAVAGVVNIITEKTLKGVILEGQVDVPQNGAGVETRLSASFGASGSNWHVIGSLEYYTRKSVTVADEKWATCPIAGYLTGAGTPFGSGDYIDPKTGKPACYTLDNGGTTINTVGVPTRTAQDRLTGALGSFNRLIPDSSITGGPTPGFAGVTYYTRDTFDPRMQQEDIVTPAKVYTGYLSGGVDIEALGNAEVYFELLGNRRDSSAPLYRQLTLDYAQGSPLLPAMFQNGFFLNPTEVSNGANVAARSFIGFGNLPSSQRVDFYRAAGGLRGDLPFSDWRYDAYVSNSASNSHYSTGTFLTDRVAQSLNVTQNADGSFSCVDPSNGCVAAPSLNAASVGGNLSPAYRNFITKNVVGTTKYQEFSGSFDVNGPLFTLPGGHAQLALGAEYRHEHINDQPPPESVAGDLYNLTSAAPTVGSDEVWETYGELDLPLLANVPFAHNLDLNASGRYTHYRSYGGQWTYKFGGQYEPIKGFGFRASYGTSYRAPALFEQFQGATTGFDSSSADPCDNYASSANPTLRANCAAAGLPSDFTQKNGVTVVNAGGAGSGLKAETSKNLSAGVVLKPVLPSSLGNFSASLDYFAIKITNGVSQIGDVNILNQCYFSASYNPNAGLCRLVSRDANNALTVLDSYVNTTTQKVKGFEFNVRWQKDIAGGSFLLDAIVTKYTEQASQLFEGDALIDANGTIGAPDWTATLNTSYKIGKVTLHYGLDWISGDHSRTYKYFATDTATGLVDPDNLQFFKDNYYLETPNYFLHNISVQYDLDKFEFTMGVRNLFNRQPPRISSDLTIQSLLNTTANAPVYSGYDFVGRTFFANVTAKF